MTSLGGLDGASRALAPSLEQRYPSAADFKADLVALRAGIPDYGMVTNPVDCTGNVVNEAVIPGR